jgi:hypothetical protein
LRLEQETGQATGNEMIQVQRRRKRNGVSMPCKVEYAVFKLMSDENCFRKISPVKGIEYGRPVSIISVYTSLHPDILKNGVGQK